MITENLSHINTFNIPKIIWIAVNYFNDNESIKFIKEQYLKQGTTDCLFLLVNNGATDSNVLKREINNWNKIELITPDKNLGYFGALNFALDYIAEKFKTYPDKVIFSNTDISLLSSDLIQNISKLKIETNVACVGPAIFKEGISVNQNPFMMNRVSRGKLLFLKTLFSNYSAYLLYQWFAYLKENTFAATKKEVPNMDVYALHGSFLIFGKSFLTSCNHMLKDAPFLFGEEIFLAEICRREEFVLNYNKAFSIMHHEHSVTGKYKSKQTVFYLHQSISLLLEKYFRREN